MSSVGERIKELRTANKLTQTDLSKLVGLTYIQVGRYETGKSKPSSDILQKLAGALGTTTDFLMNGSTNEKVSLHIPVMLTPCFGHTDPSNS